MKKIVIVGGGIAGLSAGVYAQLLGFESVLIEKNAVPGGQCTGWDRQGYHTDGCIHWMCGTKPGSDINDAWRDVGALSDDIEIIDLPSLWTYQAEGKSITLWADLDRLERELIELSPADEAEIKDFIKDVRAVGNMQMPAKLPTDMMSLKDLMAMGKAMKGAGGVMSRKGKIDCVEYGKRYKSTFLQKFFATSMPEGYSISSFIFSVGAFASGMAGIPRGGSRAMALRMADRYRALGGKLLLNTSAQEIMIEGKRATGVRLDNGELVTGDYVIAACDASFALNKLLGGRYKVKALEDRFQNERDYPTPTSLMVTYALDTTMEDVPVMVNFECEPFTIGSKTYTLAGLHHYGFEPGFAPEGKTVATSTVTMSDSDYRYFAELYKDREAYGAEKERIAALLQERIEAAIPKLKGKMTVLDVATPMTYARYCNAYHGAWMSFMTTVRSKNMMLKGNIPGLENCVLTGQWLMAPGGLPTAITTGKASIQRIAKKEGMPYIVK
ncbi:MAG: NAD(P)/FAD-dependent oxidoreductase [Eubacteriales bacterium]|nr:NAD(P)/FAD-dependent oxidoreductase [Eubacteriales bacterium]